MGQGHIRKGCTMITQDLQELFDRVMAELMAIRTDITIMKYDIEQIEAKLEALDKPEDPPTDRTLHVL